PCTLQVCHATCLAQLPTPLQPACSTLVLKRREAALAMVPLLHAGGWLLFWCYNSAKGTHSNSPGTGLVPSGLCSHHSQGQA
ncbi:unnamed protein product, partial [Coccothraustes coccothraustes]